MTDGEKAVHKAVVARKKIYAMIDEFAKPHDVKRIKSAVESYRKACQHAERVATK